MHVLWEIDKKLVGFVKLASLVIMEGLLLISFSYLCSIRSEGQRHARRLTPRPAKLAVNPELSGSPSNNRYTGLVVRFAVSS